MAMKKPAATTPAQAVKVLHKTKHLQFVTDGRWDYVRRAKATGVVCIAAKTPEGCVLLVEQQRPPVGTSVIEFPAGLAGDEQDFAAETFETAARRELLEETGYTAGHMRYCGTFPSSAGLTDEQISFFVATDLKKTSEGGGVAGEEITIHEIPTRKLSRWLKQKQQQGALIDARVFTGLYFLQRR